jgi:hypothetical protein
MNYFCASGFGDAPTWVSQGAGAKEKPPVVIPAAPRRSGIYGGVKMAPIFRSVKVQMRLVCSSKSGMSAAALYPKGVSDVLRSMRIDSANLSATNARFST